MKETEKVDSAAELRQGDILRIENIGDMGQSPDLGVIINADCDLAWGRTDGVIAYLPIYSFRSYHKFFWIPSQLSEIVKSSTGRVLELCKYEKTYGEEIARWLATAEVEKVLNTLIDAAKIKKSDQEGLSKHLSKLKICNNKFTAPLEAFSSICKLEKDPKSYAYKQLTAAKIAMGDGHFFISDLSGHEELGFVIRMLRIYTIDASCCFTSVAAQKSSSNGKKTTAVRTARLTDIYQFKIAQMFAHQYSRIGLPDEITALDALAIDDIATKITEDII